MKRTALDAVSEFQTKCQNLGQIYFPQKNEQANDLLLHLTELATKRSRQVFKEAVAEKFRRATAPSMFETCSQKHESAPIGF